MTQRIASTDALGALLEFANSHRPSARQAANFMLAWWHAPSCGAFDVQDLCQIGDTAGELVAKALGEIPNAGSPQASPLAPGLKELIARWRAGTDISSIGHRQAPSLGLAPTLAMPERRALARLVRYADKEGPASACATFLGSWHDADQCGGFNPASVTQLRADVLAAMQTVVRLVVRSRCHPGATGYGPDIARVARRSRPDCEGTDDRNRRLMAAITGTRRA